MADQDQRPQKTQRCAAWLEGKRRALCASLRRAWGWFKDRLKDLLDLIRLLPDLLDWLIKVVERLTLLAMAGSMMWIAYRLIVLLSKGRVTFEGSTVVALVGLIHDKWRAFLILAIPLFYKTVRGFLEEVEEFAGMKRNRAVRPAKEVDTPPRAGDSGTQPPPIQDPPK